MALGKKTGGRKAGIPNKVTADVRALAGEYGPVAIAELARLAVKAENEQARVAACKELLDRAYGKSVQSIDHSGDVNVTCTVIEGLKAIVAHRKSRLQSGVLPVANGHAH